MPFSTSVKQSIIDWERSLTQISKTDKASVRTKNFVEESEDSSVDKTTETSYTLYETPNLVMKYNEEELLKELRDYIIGTYSQHYATDKIQTLDLIDACGDAEAFCRSNILKYASRYDKKGTARRDIIKILHYGLLLLHFSDKSANREEYPQ